MSYALVIEDAAADEIRQAYNWYLQTSETAAANFERETVEAFERLQGGKVDYRIAISNVRALPLIIFPYVIYYKRVEETLTVQIIAVLHNRRAQAFVETRLRNN